MGNGPPLTPQHVYAATVILKHVDALSAQLEGVRQADDIECVHQMRVASRRLRNAIRLFEDYLPGRKSKKWLKRSSWVTRVLGEARDTDVQIDFVNTFLKAIHDKEKQDFQSGVARLLLRLNQHRRRIQEDVVAAMDQLESTGLTEDIQKTLRAVQIEGRALNLLEDHRGMRPQASETILRRLEEMFVFTPYITQPELVDELHQMRIAAKHLRYTLESYAPLFEEDLKPTISLTKQIQTSLGDIHDCDVWIEFLPQFLEQEQTRFVEFFGHAAGFARIKRGINYLLENRKQQRDQLYNDFLKLWHQTLEDGTWDRFRKLFQGWRESVSLGNNETQRMEVSASHP